MQAKHNNKTIEAIHHWENAAEKDHHPVACIMLASHYLKENDIENVKRVLQDGLAYGLTTQQFCNRNMILSLSGFTDGLISGPYDQHIKQELLPIIKIALEKNDLLTNFCELFQQITTINLSTIPEWII